MANPAISRQGTPWVMSFVLAVAIKMHSFLWCMSGVVKTDAEKRPRQLGSGRGIV